MTAQAEAPPDAELDEGDRAPLLSRRVLVTGLVVGLALVVLMYWGGADPHVLAAGFPGYVAGFVLTAVACVAVGTALAELLRRHGKRAALASARAAGNRTRAAGTRARQWACPRWQRRLDAIPTGGQMTVSDPEVQRIYEAIQQAWCARDDPPFRVVRSATAQFIAYLPPPPGMPPDASKAAYVLSHQEHSEQALAKALGRPVFIDGYQSPGGVRLRLFTLPDDVAGAPAPAVSAGEEPLPVTTAVDPAPYGRRRLSGEQKASAPAGWQAVANDAAEFEPESDEELLDWMGAEVAGMFVYGEAVVDLYETCIDGVRLDPVAMAALHDVGDAVADAAAAMAEARQKFATHYAEIREFVAQGGVLPKDGDWITGEGDAA